MGLFDKKYCDICGEKVNMLTQKKLSDGQLCSDCKHKLGSLSQAAGSRELFRMLKITLSKENKTSRNISSSIVRHQQAEEAIHFKSISITAGLSLLLITEILTAAILRFLNFHSFRIFGLSLNTERLTIQTTTVFRTTGMILTTDSLTIITATAEI